jgi:hypothetical protein
MSLAALAVALSIVVAAVVLRPTKPLVTLRDPSTLPHVDRPFPKLTSNVSLDENATIALLGKFQNALNRDPSTAGVVKVTFDHDAQNELVAHVQTQSGTIDAASLGDPK